MPDPHLRRLRLIAAIVPFLVATVIVSMKLPGDVMYAGTDEGFATVSPMRHVFDLVWYSWSFFATGYANGMGSVNLYNVLVTPYYVPIDFLQLFHLSPAATSHVLEILKYGLLGLGAYVLSATILGTSNRKDVLTCLGIGLFAMFNELVALWLLIPVSQFQLAFALWPCIIAWEIRLLRARRSGWEIAGFVTLIYYALSFNLAHTVCGFLLLLAVAVWQALAARSVRELGFVGLMTAGALLLFSMPFWLSIIAYHFTGATPIISSTNLSRADSLLGHISTSNSLSSFAGLFRLNTIVWWPTVAQAKPFDNPLTALASLSLAALAVAGLLNRNFDATTRRFWGTVWIVALFLAKGMHAPLGGYYASLVVLPGADMFRESNDKFLLVAYVATIALAAIGLRSVSRPLTRGLVGLALAISALPFVFGQPYVQQFFVRLPADYAHVAALLDRTPDRRVLAFAPSNLNDQGSTYWFHGGNLDTALFRNPVTYATTLQALPFSEAPLYGDERLASAQEYFADRQLGRILGIGYVLVHKDFTERLDIGFEQQSLRVNGSEISRAVMAQCLRDQQLEQIYDGPDLALFRVRTADAPLSAMARLHAVRGYANALFPLLELAPGNRGFAFSGAQNGDIGPTVPAAAYVDKIRTFVTAPTSAMATDQVLSSPDLEQTIATGFAGLPVPDTDVGAMPPGDIQSSNRKSDVLSVKFPVKPAGQYPMTAFYRHVPGYSAVEANGLRFLPHAVAADPGPAVGMSGNVSAMLASPNTVSRSVDVNVPLGGTLQAFIAVSAARRTLGRPAALELSLQGPGGPVALWIVASFYPLGTAQQAGADDLQHLLGLEPVLGSINLNVEDVIESSIKDAGNRELLYRPGLRVVRATLYMQPSPSEVLHPPSIAAIRLYDANANDYFAQDAVASAVSPTMTLAAPLPTSSPVPTPVPGYSPALLTKFRLHPAPDAPGASVLVTDGTTNGESVKVTYAYPRWVPNQLVLRTFAISTQAGTYATTITYTYRGKQYSVSGPVPTSTTRIPYDAAPLALDDPDAAAAETANWEQITVDLRGFLPDLPHSIVRQVVLTRTLQDVTAGSSWFLFGPLEGLRNDASGYPLTGLIVNGQLSRPVAATRQGYDALVDFGRVTLSATQPAIVTTTKLQGNIPHAVAIGTALTANGTTASGSLIDPTVGTISLASAGIIELATTYNKAWIVRAGATRPGGPLPALQAFLATKPQAAPHFVTEGFANAWAVPPGDYTVIFVPQIARDVAFLLIAAICALALVAWIAAYVRRSRSAAA
jgi:hypothetical protein